MEIFVCYYICMKKVLLLLFGLLFINIKEDPDIGYLKDRLLQIYIGSDDCFDIADKVWVEPNGHDIILNCHEILNKIN